jgi:hypothetical protein
VCPKFHSLYKIKNCLFLCDKSFSGPARSPAGWTSHRNLIFTKCCYKNIHPTRKVLLVIVTLGMRSGPNIWLWLLQELKLWRRVINCLFLIDGIWYADFTVWVGCVSGITSGRVILHVGQQAAAQKVRSGPHLYVRDVFQTPIEAPWAVLVAGWLGWSFDLGDM